MYDCARLRARPESGSRLSSETARLRLASLVLAARRQEDRGDRETGEREATRGLESRRREDRGGLSFQLPALRLERLGFLTCSQESRDRFYILFKFQIFLKKFG